MQSSLDMMGTYNDAYFCYIMSLFFQFVKPTELYIIELNTRYIVNSITQTL